MPIKMFFSGKPKAQKKNTVSFKTKVTNWFTSKNKKERKATDNGIGEHQNAIPEQQLNVDDKTRKILGTDKQLVNEKQHRWTQLEAENWTLKNTLDTVKLDLAIEKETVKSLTLQLEIEKIDQITDKNVFFDYLKETFRVKSSNNKNVYNLFGIVNKVITYFCSIKGITYL